MRLPNGFGSVYKLSGKRRKPFAARKTTGWNDQGQPIYQFIGYYASRQDALTALVEYNKDPFDLNLSGITLGEVYDKWSEEHFAKIVDSRNYKSAWNVLKPLKDMKIVDIKLDHLQNLINESGKHKPTLKNVKIELGLMYDWCIKHEILPADKRKMISYIDISASGNPDSRKHFPFSKDEIKTMWKYQPTNTYINLFLIMIYSGVRISELLDLKKSDVHLEEKWFFVGKSKTPAGIRQVPIADKILPFMEYWMNQKSEYLICNQSGNHMSYRVFLENYWEPLLDVMGIDKKHKPHDTRHTCVSLLTEAGVDQRWIRKIVGHAGQGVTETVYTHIDLDKKLEAINKI